MAPKVHRGLALVLAALLRVLGGCAEQQMPTATIEPPEQRSAAPAPAKAEAASKDEFVLSREVAQWPKPVAPGRPIHVGDRWWKFRADFLGLNDADVRERDAAIPERQPPGEFWDQQMAIESASIWGVLCNECHGGRRQIEDALRMPSPAAQWGKGEGLFFGNRRRYVDLFAIMSNGGPKRDDGRPGMPAWKGKLAKEQMWALLYFLEYQSGGIEGRFPPSLYPRQTTVPE